MTFGGLCSHQLLSCCRLKFLHKHQWMYWPSLSCPFRYSVGASKGQPDKMWSIVLMCYQILCILGQHHFLICLLENFLLVGSGPVLLWWSPQSQILGLMKLASDWSVKNLYIRATSTNRVFTMERFIFPSLFQSLIFLVFTFVLICFSFSVDEEFSEMLSVLRLISLKYFFASVVIEYIRLFCSCFFYKFKHPILCVV